MSDLPWSKFFWSDWESDEGLRQCSLAAQGLWMRMLCICAKGDPPGYLAIAGNPLDVSGVAKAAGISMSEAETLMVELDQWGVFSRDRKGRIYSRRMVRDQKRSRDGKKYAKRRWSQGTDNKKELPLPNGSPKGVPKLQNPEAREEKKQVSPVPKSSSRKATRLPSDWQPTAGDLAFARQEGLSDREAQREAEKFRDYWLAKAGSGGTKLDWSRTWNNWVRTAAERKPKARALPPPGDEHAGRVAYARRTGKWPDQWGPRPPELDEPVDQLRLVQ